MLKLEKIPRWILKFSGWISLFGVLSALGSGFFTVQLFRNLKTDIEELLPTQARSVQDLNQVTNRLESFDSLSVVVFTKDKVAGKKFVIDLAELLEKAPNDTVAYVEYRIDKELEFFKHRRALFIETKDLVAIRDYIRKRIEYEKSIRNPLSLFTFENLLEPQLDISELRRKYESQISVYSRYPGGFYSNADESIRVMQVYLPGKFSGVDSAHRLRDYVVESVAKLNPKQYAADLEVKYSGGIQNLIEEHAALIADLGLSTVLVIVLVTAAMWIYFRSARVTAVLLISLLIGTFWTFGIAYFLVGYLNANSAFMASIVVGNGINFGIIYLARYLEERRNKRRSHEHATYLAWMRTLGGTATGAMAAGLSYGALMLTAFRGFSQFGIIGLIGMVLCWLSAYTLLPAFLTVCDRLGWLEGKRIVLPPGKQWFSRRVATWVARFPKPILVTSIVLTALSSVVIFTIDKRVIESDLSKLRDKKSIQSGSAYLSKYVDEVLQRYGSPLIFLPETKEDAQKIYARLKQIREREGKNSLIDIITFIEDFVPQNQFDKLVILNEIRGLLTPQVRAAMGPSEKAIVDEFFTSESAKPFTVDELPSLLKRKLSEKDGSVGKMVLVEPPVGGAMKEGDLLISFIARLRTVANEMGKPIPVAGQLAVSADMIEAIQTDGPKATLFAFLGVLLLVIILFRRPSVVFQVIMALLLGVIWMIAFAHAMGWKINFLNFIALPITFGIGVDYGVNMFQRYQSDMRRRTYTNTSAIGKLLRKIRLRLVAQDELRPPVVQRSVDPAPVVPPPVVPMILNTGGAVGLASLTTIIGYGSLLIASNQAFVSFGQLAVLGEVTCLMAALFTLPAYLEFRRERKRKQLLQFRGTRFLP